MKNVKKKYKKESKSVEVLVPNYKMIHVSSNTNGLQHSEQVLLQRVSKFCYILNIS